MPEFILDHGSHEATNRLALAGEFVEGYLEAAFFTECQSGDDVGEASLGELSVGAWNDATRACAKFQADAQADLDEALDNGRINGYDLQAAGRDFWYSRNGHGVGFWDRGLGDVGDKLHIRAKAFGDVTLYRGDDGELYFGG